MDPALAPSGMASDFCEVPGPKLTYSKFRVKGLGIKVFAGFK